MVAIGAAKSKHRNAGPWRKMAVQGSVHGSPARKLDLRAPRQFIEGNDVHSDAPGSISTSRQANADLVRADPSTTQPRKIGTSPADSLQVTIVRVEFQTIRHRNFEFGVASGDRAFALQAYHQK